MFKLTASALIMSAALLIMFFAHMGTVDSPMDVVNYVINVSYNPWFIVEDLGELSFVDHVNIIHLILLPWIIAFIIYQIRILTNSSGLFS